jgi:hypothetical protein
LGRVHQPIVESRAAVWLSRGWWCPVRERLCSECVGIARYVVAVTMIALRNSTVVRRGVVPALKVTHLLPYAGMSHTVTWSSRPLYRSQAAVVTSSSGGLSGW